MTLPGRLRAALAAVPLTRRLVAVLLLLLVVGLTSSGAVAVGSLRGYLLQRVDAGLTSAAGVDRDGPDADDGPGRTLPDRGRGHSPDGLSPYWIGFADASGTAVVTPSAATSSPPALPAGTALAAAAGRGAFTVGSADGRGSWRVLVSDDGPGLAVVAVSTADVDSTVRRLLLVDLASGGALVLLLGGASLLLVRSSLRPLHRVEQTAVAIAAGDLSSRVPDVPAGTEVGRLSRAFNQMLEQVEQAFAAERASQQRVRQFVADASHELRTPLTTIRGFAELYRAGAVGDDLPRVMSRVEGEAQRMGALVDELLLLARLDQARPLELAPVDVAVVAADVVHDAASWSGDHAVVLTAAPGCVVEGDDARLRQVLVNLLRNAVVHTPAGTRVDVLVERAGDEVHLQVRDDGPGLTDEQAGLVFDRFYRADTARTRAAGGSGLGLSIVAALVAAHGGRVHAGGAPGRGAAFDVLLPARAQPAEKTSRPKVAGTVCA